MEEVGELQPHRFFSKFDLLQIETNNEKLRKVINYKLVESSQNLSPFATLLNVRL